MNLQPDLFHYWNFQTGFRPIIEVGFGLHFLSKDASLVFIEEADLVTQTEIFTQKDLIKGIAWFQKNNYINAHQAYKLIQSIPNNSDLTHILPKE